jgi:hypothetical protein
MTTTVNGTATATATAALANLESSLNEIFLAVGDFLEFNARTSSLYTPPLPGPINALEGWNISREDPRMKLAARWN